MTCTDCLIEANTHRNRLLGTACKFLLGVFDFSAEDLLQYAYVKFLEKDKRLEGSEALKWLTEVMRNKAIDERRKQAVRVKRPKKSHAVGAPAPDFLLKSEIRKALRREPPEIRAAVLGHLIHDKPLSLLSAETGVSMACISARFYRGKAILRDYLSKPTKV